MPHNIGGQCGQVLGTSLASDDISLHSDSYDDNELPEFARIGTGPVDLYHPSLDLLKSTLKQNEKQQLKKFLTEYSSVVFLFTPEGLGQRSVVQHDIDTADSSFIRPRPYRVGPEVHEFLK